MGLRKLSTTTVSVVFEAWEALPLLLSLPEEDLLPNLKNLESMCTGYLLLPGGVSICWSLSLLTSVGGMGRLVNLVLFMLCDASV